MMFGHLSLHWQGITMHASLDDWTKFLLALGPVLTGIVGAISAWTNHKLRKQSEKLDKHDEKLTQLSKDVNGRVNELVDAKAEAAKLEVLQSTGIIPRGHNSRWNDDPLAKEGRPATEIVKEAVKEAIVEVKQAGELPVVPKK